MTPLSAVPRAVLLTCRPLRHIPPTAESIVRSSVSDRAGLFVPNEANWSLWTNLQHSQGMILIDFFGLMCGTLTPISGSAAPSPGW